MTISETLALNVDSVQIVGAAGEPEFGSPRTLDTHSELNEWMEGLRAGDGSGCVPAILRPRNGLTLCRNVLKLRKAKKLAQERGESSVTETPTVCERRDDWPGKQIDVGHYPVQSERKANAEQHDWREVRLPSMLYLFH
jgi:hypothetical protein